MKRKGYKAKLLIPAMVLMTASMMMNVVGCTGSDESSPIVDGDVDLPDNPDGDPAELAKMAFEEGKSWLEKGQANEARPFFAQAVQYDPDMLEAHFGLAFAESQVTWEFLSAFLTMAGQIMSADPPDWVNEEKGTSGGEYDDLDDPQSQSEWLAQQVHVLFGNMSQSLGVAVEHYGIIINSEQATDFVYTIDTEIPIYMSLERTAALTGEIRLPEIYMFDSMSRLYLSVTRMISMLDLRGDLSDVVNFVQSHKSSLDINTLMPVIVDLLNSDERFMGATGDTAALGAEMKTLWTGALNDVKLSFEAAKAEVDECVRTEGAQPTNRSFFCFLDRKGEELRLHMRKPDPENPGEDYDMFLTVFKAEDMTVIDTFVANLADGQSPMDLREEILPVLSSIVAVVNAYGMLDLLNLDLGLGDAATPDVVGSFLGTFLPKGAAMNFGAFFNDPTSLRGLLPVWTSDKPRRENTLYMEWECPGELEDDEAPNGSGGLLCAAEDADGGLVDSAHFVGTDNEQPADGVLLQTPYFVWQDPTLGGLLYIDPTELDLEGPAGYAPATQAGTNVFIGAVVDGVMGFVGKKK